MRTFFGYLPDPVGHRYNLFFRHPAARGALVEAASIDEFAPPIWNQRASNSCVGHGTSGALTTTYAAKGIPLISPASAGFLYRLGRCVDRRAVNGKLPPLTDNGAEPNQLVRAIDVWGVPLESEVDGERGATSPDYEDYLEAHINDEPEFGDLLVGDERKITGVNAVESKGEACVEEVCRAFADGYAVMAGVSAGNQIFQGHREGVLEPSGDRPDHWVYFTAHRTVNGLKQILMRNSWGPDWAEAGKTWCSENYIRRGLWNVLVANLGL